MDLVTWLSLAGCALPGPLVDTFRITLDLETNLANWFWCLKNLAISGPEVLVSLLDMSVFLLQLLVDFLAVLISIDFP
jgi:hypothetical protein